MADELTKLTVSRRPNGMFKIAYDGTVLGDDRAYPTEELARRAIRDRLARDRRDAVTYGRPLLYVEA